MTMKRNDEYMEALEDALSELHEEIDELTAAIAYMEDSNDTSKHLILLRIGIERIENLEELYILSNLSKSSHSGVIYVRVRARKIKRKRGCSNE